MQSLEVIAPAKINLILSIRDRQVNGYHNIWSLMQMLDLHDSLYVSCDTTDDGREVANSWPIPFLPITVECDDAQLPCDEKNLAYRAAKATMEKAAMYPKLHIRITKRIPVSAGLGGGSSDAAATILALNRLLHLEWDQMECAQLGVAIGSDVPFFFFGPMSIVRGNGSDIISVTVQQPQWVVLVKPPISISTTWAYAQLDVWRSSHKEERLFANDEVLQELLRSSQSHEALSSYCCNEFEPIMEEQVPIVGLIRQEHLELGADIAMLSGSGSTVFGIYPSEHTARIAERWFRSYQGYQVLITKTRVA